MQKEDVTKGIITRIYVKNFVTYDEVTIRPGKNFNLIIGPNGTGKSTIVCAIVLGLGGSTKVINRAKYIGDFVKSGQTNAIIEIDLQNDHKNCVTIKRMFNTQSHSTWFVNNKTTNSAHVNELMKSFNIQIDNLCQFLPQDKVQDFSKLQAPQLLRETERSVGDPKLLEYHENLIELRKKQAELEKELERNAKLFDNDKQLYESLKDSVGHIKEQKKFQKKLTSLKQKKAWILYQNKREEFTKAKKDRDEAALKMKKAEQKMEPAKKKFEKLKSSIRTLQKTAQQHQSETNAKRNRLNKLIEDIEKHETSVNDINAQCKEDIKTEEERDERLNQIVEDKNKLENDVTELENDVGLVEQITENLNTITMQLNDQRKILNDKKNHETYFKQQIDHNNRKIQAEEQNLQEVYNIENKRLDMLRKLSNDAYSGVLWLRHNKHLFSRPIHEPMILNINLKDPSYSKYFENIILPRDLTAFVCEDKNDMNLLVKYLRDQQKLKINAVHSDPNKEVDFRPPIPLENIKQFGFHNYLVSLIEAPKTILNYIISMYRINEIPIGSDHVVNYIDQIPERLNRFFSATNFYTVSKSKYTREKSTRQSNISSKGTLAIIVDTNKIQKIEREINAAKEKVSALSVELQQCQEQIITLTQEIESNKVQRNKLQTNKSKIDNLKVRINVADGKIKLEQQNRRNINDIRSEYKKKIQNILKQQINVYQSYNNVQDEHYKSYISDEEMKLQIKLKKYECSVLEENSRNMQSVFLEAERIYLLLDKDLTPLKNEVTELYAAAKETTDGLCYDSKEFAPIKIVFAKLPASIEEIITEIQTTQAKIFCLRNDQSEANRILQQYNNAKKNMEHLAEVITKKEDELAKITEEIGKIKDKWYPAILALVEQINSNFSKYFIQMKCAGEVSLSHDTNDMDFEKYGLKIRVKFRDADDLQELTRNHQSGGERAVTTAVYMIALQELTRVPFRCVDEINQGMDATNERRVFNLIVDITSKSNSSQYFMLTPKLLPRLKYNETITVLTVFNGKYMIPCSKLDISQNCDKIVETVLRRQGEAH